METTASALRVAIVDDDQTLRESLRDLLESVGIEGVLYESADALLRDPMAIMRIDCVLTDLRMPGRSGLDLLAELDPGPTNPPVLMMTAFADPFTEARARSLGAAAFIVKPIDPAELIRLIRLCATTRGPA